MMALPDQGNPASSYHPLYIPSLALQQTQQKPAELSNLISAQILCQLEYEN